MRLDDTIAAISSGGGPAARMIIRASGSRCDEILHQICADVSPAPVARRGVLTIKSLRVGAWVYRFASPKSYTGDDLFELHIPGNPLLARWILERLVELGTRRAEPGEFTARALFNARIDLSQAEGVAAVVSAGNEAELQAGRRLMAGELSLRLRPIIENVAQTLALVEAEIDFSDQDVKFLSAHEAAARLADVEGNLSRLLSGSGRLSRLSHEPRLVLAGRPNAGKSTLLNALSKSFRAVVSDVPGTTRDALSAAVVLKRGLVRVVDVAGLDGATSTNEIETQMQDRARTELERADGVILVRDCLDDDGDLELPLKTNLTVWTKADLLPAAISALTPTPGTLGEGRGEGLIRGPCVKVSTHTGSGMDQLRNALDDLAFGNERTATAELALTSRHISAIESALVSIQRCRELHAAELVAAELRLALDFLGQVLGDVTPDDILGRVFATFCIGK